MEALGKGREGGVKCRAAGGRHSQHRAIKSNVTLCQRQGQPAAPGGQGRAGGLLGGGLLVFVYKGYVYTHICVCVCVPTLRGSQAGDPNGPSRETQTPPGAEVRSGDCRIALSPRLSRGTKRLLASPAWMLALKRRHHPRQWGLRGWRTLGTPLQRLWEGVGWWRPWQRTCRGEGCRRRCCGTSPSIAFLLPLLCAPRGSPELGNAAA